MLFKRSKELHNVDTASLCTTLNEVFWWEFKKLLSNKLQPEDVSVLYELRSQSGSSRLELPHSLNAIVKSLYQQAEKSQLASKLHIFSLLK